MPRAELGDLELHFEERGSGLALLLIACIPAIANDWASLAEPLSASRRVVAYDNRGSGASTVTPGPYTTAQLAAEAWRCWITWALSGPTCSACRWAA